MDEVKFLNYRRCHLCDQVKEVQIVRLVINVAERDQKMRTFNACSDCRCRHLGWVIEKLSGPEWAFQDETA